MSTNTTLAAVLRELSALQEPRKRDVNERRGDDHGVNLTQLRSIAKRLKTQHELALQLWATRKSAARLLATLVCKPKRAIGIGERLAVLIDYPASPGCTPPYAPVWIAEMVRRREGPPSRVKKAMTKARSR